MPIPASGAISFSDIRTVFGGSAPDGLSEYYKGGANVTDNATTVQNLCKMHACWALAGL